MDVSGLISVTALYNIISYGPYFIGHIAWKLSTQHLSAPKQWSLSTEFSLFSVEHAICYMRRLQCHHCYGKFQTSYPEKF